MGIERKLARETNCKVVGERVAGWNSALRDLGCTVHVGCAIHEYTMHMETCGLIAESIVGIDNNIVSFGDVKWRDGPLSVDTNDRSTIFGARRRLWVDPRNVEVVRDCSGKRYECEQDERWRW